MGFFVRRGSAPAFGVLHGHPGFQRLERVVISSLADEKTVFYVDNVMCVADEK